jgi:hypothetical protein
MNKMLLDSSLSSAFSLAVAVLTATAAVAAALVVVTIRRDFVLRWRLLVHIELACYRGSLHRVRLDKLEAVVHNTAAVLCWFLCYCTNL